MDRPVWRSDRLHTGDAGGGGCHLFPHLGNDISTVPHCRVFCRYRRRVVRSRYCLCFAVVSDRKTGDRPRYFRCRQCRRGGNKVPRAIRACRLWLAGGRPDLGRRYRDHGDRVLVFHRRRSGPCCKTRTRRKAAQRLARAGVTQECPGLALRALLFLRVWRLRRTGAVAAAVPDQRLRGRHQDGRHGGCGILASGKRFPCLWRSSVRSLWRTTRHVLDLPGRHRLHLRALVSADRLHRPHDQRPTSVPPRNGGGAVHGDRICARLLHGLGQGRRLQAYPRLLSEKCRRRRWPGRNDRRARWLRASRLLSARSTISPGFGPAASCCCSDW